MLTESSDVNSKVICYSCTSMSVASPSSGTTGTGGCKVTSFTCTSWERSGGNMYAMSKPSQVYFLHRLSELRTPLLVNTLSHCCPSYMKETTSATKTPFLANHNLVCLHKCQASVDMRTTYVHTSNSQKGARN